MVFTPFIYRLISLSLHVLASEAIYCYFQNRLGYSEMPSLAMLVTGFVPKCFTMTEMYVNTHKNKGIYCMCMSVEIKQGLSRMV